MSPSGASSVRKCTSDFHLSLLNATWSTSTSAHKMTNNVYVSAERRFQIRLLCFIIAVDIWKSNLLQLVLKALDLKSNSKGTVRSSSDAAACVHPCFLCWLQVSLQWAYPGPGSRPSVPAGCLLHPTLLQGASSHVSPSARFLLTSHLTAACRTRAFPIRSPSPTPLDRAENTSVSVRSSQPAAGWISHQTSLLIASSKQSKSCQMSAPRTDVYVKIRVPNRISNLEPLLAPTLLCRRAFIKQIEMYFSGVTLDTEAV